jgi:hypothetical protein
MWGLQLWSLYSQLVVAAAAAAVVVSVAAEAAVSVVAEVGQLLQLAITQYNM